ncbi:hypothetical protein HK101_006592, partial [Irineochytrium annulatum]
LAGSGEMAVAAAAIPLLEDVLGQQTIFRTAVDGSILISEADDLDALIGLLQPAYALYDPNRADLSRHSEGVIVERPAFMSRDFLRVLSYVDESLALYLSKSEDAYGDATVDTDRRRSELIAESLSQKDIDHWDSNSR